MGTSNQEHPWLPHCPGDMEERMRKVMVTGLVQRVSILLLSYLRMCCVKDNIVVAAPLQMGIFSLPLTGNTSCCKL